MRDKITLSHTHNSHSPTGEFLPTKTNTKPKDSKKTSKTDLFSFPPINGHYSGVDWITVTQHKTPGCDLLYKRAKTIVNLEHKNGNDITHLKGFGYHGTRSGGASAGQRQDTYICTLSSECAAEHWHSLSFISTNCSRIDLQTTFLFEAQSMGFFDDLHHHLLTRAAARGRQATLSRVQDNKDSNTIYIGSKQSDLLIRIYDKGIEQGTHERERLIRAEIQLRNNLAWRYLTELRSIEKAESTITASIIKHLSRFKISIPILIDSSLEVARVDSVSDTQKRLAYLQKSVRPLVEKLCDQGYVNEVLAILFGSDDGLTQALLKADINRKVFKYAD